MIRDLDVSSDIVQTWKEDLNDGLHTTKATYPLKQLRLEGEARRAASMSEW